MQQTEKNISINSAIILLLVFSNAVILKVAFIGNENWYWALIVTAPLLLLAAYGTTNKKI